MRVWYREPASGASLRNASFGLDPHDLTGLDRRQRLQEQRNKHSKIGQPIRGSAEDDHCEWQGIDTLLKCKVPVDRDECIELPGGARQQCAVLDAGPAKLDNRTYFVSGDVASQSPVDTFVEQKPHDAVSINRSLANSRKEITCSRLTLGKPSRKSSIDSPASR